MNKLELVRTVSEKTQIPQKQVEQTLNGIIDAIGDALASHEAVQLVGFGSFVVKDVAARVGRNPRTGEELSIPARKAPGVRAGKQLKERLG